jgi:hypothetical protein
MLEPVVVLHYAIARRAVERCSGRIEERRFDQPDIEGLQRVEVKQRLRRAAPDQE